jgi:hypothetical protein
MKSSGSFKWNKIELVSQTPPHLPQRKQQTQRGVHSQTETSPVTEYDEFKILAINTPFLWRKGVEEKWLNESRIRSGVNKNNYSINKKFSRLKVDRDGISLMPYHAHSRAKSFPIPVTLSVGRKIDFAIDDCQIMYILYSTMKEKRVLVYDLNSELTESIDNVNLSEPKAIRVSDKAVYILDLMS